MAIVYSSFNDGYAGDGLDGTFAACRSGPGNLYDNNNARDASPVFAFQSARGGGSWGLRRAFLDFDTSSINTTVSSATLRIYGYVNSDADVIVVRSEHGTTLAASDFNSFPAAAVTALGNSDGSGAGTFAGISGLTYSAEFTTWVTYGYNNIALNATALSDMESLSTFKICIMEYDYDYLDITTPNSSSLDVGIYWSENHSTLRDPYIDYTAVAAVTHNATFFGANF